MDHIAVKVEPIDNPTHNTRPEPQMAVLFYADTTASFGLAFDIDAAGNEHTVAFGRRPMEHPTIQSLLSGLGERNARLTLDTPDPYAWEHTVRTRVGEHHVIGLTNPSDPTDRRVFIQSPDRKRTMALQGAVDHPSYRHDWGPESGASDRLFVVDAPRLIDTSKAIQGRIQGRFGDRVELTEGSMLMADWLYRQPPNWSATANTLSDFVMGLDETGHDITSNLSIKQLGDLRNDTFPKPARQLRRRGLEL